MWEGMSDVAVTTPPVPLTPCGQGLGVNPQLHHVQAVWMLARGFASLGRPFLSCKTGTEMLTLGCEGRQ